MLIDITICDNCLLASVGKQPSRARIARRMAHNRSLAPHQGICDTIKQFGSKRRLRLLAKVAFKILEVDPKNRTVL